MAPRLRLSTMMSIKKRVGGVAAAAMIVTVLLAGCSAGDSGSDSAGTASVAEPAAGVANGAGTRQDESAAAPDGDAARSAAGLSDAGTSDAGTAGAGGAGAGGDPGSALPAGAQVVRTAGQTVRVDDVRAAAARARTAAVALGGYVASENLYLGTDGGPRPVDSEAGASSTMTLRVPQKSTDTMLDRLAAIGTELNRTSTADDVTAQIADLDSRQKTQEASVKRVRALLDRATSLKDVVLLESELSRREGELEAAQARYRALDDQSTLATVNLQLVSDDSPLPPEEDDDGFLSGLTHGWDALGSSTVAVLTVIGAVLPFAVLFAVIGFPVYLVRRRFNPARPVQPAAGPVPPSNPGPPSDPAGPDQP